MCVSRVASEDALTLLAPHRVKQSVDRNPPVGVDQQGGKDSRRFRPSDRVIDAVHLYAERPQIVQTERLAGLSIGHRPGEARIHLETIPDGKFESSVSTLREADSVTIEQHVDPTKPADGRSAVIYVAQFAGRTNARRGEDLLGQLCADGDLDVLDGAMVDWPPAAAAPLWRPLQNLPRLAALPDSAWTTALLHPPDTDQSALLPHPRALARDHSTIIAICITATADRVHDELTRAGARVRTTTISAQLYTELRHTYRFR